VGGDLDLAVADLLDGDGIPEVSDTAIDLDLVLKELLESSGVEDLVAGRLRSVDDELILKMLVCTNCDQYQAGVESVIVPSSSAY